MGTDNSSSMQIMLDDRQVRTLLGKRAETVQKEVILSSSKVYIQSNKIYILTSTVTINMQNNKQNKIPKELHDLNNKEVTIKLLIKEVNVMKRAKMYWTTNICEGFYIDEEETNQSTQNLQQSNAEVSVYKDTSYQNFTKHFY